MASKLFDIFNQWFKNSIKTDTKSEKEIESAVDALEKLRIEQIKYLNLLKNLETEQKKYTKYSSEYNAVQRELEKIKDRLETQDQKELELYEKIAKAANLTEKQLESFLDQLEENGKGAVNGLLSAKRSKDILSNVTKGLNFDIKSLAEEFLTLGAIVAATFQQIIKSNDLLVNNLIRKGGALRPKDLGFDYYGNNQASLAGSLSTIGLSNNVSPESFFSALEGFSKGNVAGLTFDLQKSSVALQEFAINQAKLIELYGVSSESVARITENTTQFYGSSLKDLNKEFDHGNKVIKASGLSVKQYFENLAALSDMIGEKYFKGGTTGLEKFAELSTKLNATPAALLAFTNGLETMGDLFEKQGKSVALGLQNFARELPKVFAEVQTGNYDSALKSIIPSLAKDLERLGYIDKKGVINKQGLDTLKASGLDKESIQVLQRTVQTLKKTNVSFDELANMSELSASKLFEFYSEANKTATIQDKLEKTWGAFKGAIIDPLASLLGPVLDVALNGLILGFNLLSKVLTPVKFIFQVIGNAFSKVADAIAGVTGWLTEKFGVGLKDVSGIVDTLGNVLLGLIAITAALRAQMLLNLAAEKLKGVGNLLGKGKNLLGGLFSKGGGALEGALGSTLMKGLGRASVAGGAGYLAGSLIDNTDWAKNNNIKTGGALTGVGTGAAIGSVVPIIGTVIGGVIGGIVGLVTDYWDDIKDWWKDLWSWGKDEHDEKKSDNFKINNYLDSFDGFSKVNEILNNRVVENLESSITQEKLVSKYAGKPVVKVTTGFMGEATVKAQGY